MSLTPSIQKKLETLLDRHQELSVMMNDPDIAQYPQKFADYSKEYAQLEALASLFSECQKLSALIENFKRIFE